MSLFAPLAVTVEVRSDDRRVFRLSRALADTALHLERPVPFEIGTPVTAAFVVPDEGAGETVVLHAVVARTDADGDGEHGGRALQFVEPAGEATDAIGRYIHDRLGLRRGAMRQ